MEIYGKIHWVLVQIHIYIVVCNKILFCLQVDEPEPEKKVVIRQASRQCGVPLQPAVQKKLPTRFEEFSFQARDERKKQQLVEKLRRTEEEKLKEVFADLSHQFDWFI